MPTSDLLARSRSSLATDARSWLLTLLIVVSTYLFCSNGLVLFAGQWQIALLVGALAALFSATWQQAAILSVVPLVLLELSFPPLLLEPFVPALDVPASALAAGLVAAGLGWAKSSRPASASRLKMLVSAILVLMVVGNLWAPLFVRGLPVQGYGPLKRQVLSQPPVPGKIVNDEQLYRRTFYLLHDGVPYYRAFVQSWHDFRGEPALPTSVAAYRLPTMYWLWRLLPNDAFNIEYLFLVFASLGIVAAAFIAGQLAGPQFAPSAALAVAAYAMCLGIFTYVTYIDFPATCVALIGVALLVRGRIRDDERFMWGAAAAMTLAALTREILVYFIVFAAVGSLLGAKGRRLRSVAPWVAALAVFAVGYGIHAYAVQTIVHPAKNPGTVTYLHGSFAFAVDSLVRFSDVIVGGRFMLPLLFLLGVIGAVVAYRRAGWSFAAFGVLALVLPLLAFLKIGNLAVAASGQQINYWGNLIVPLALALWPVSLAWLGWRPSPIAATPDEAEPAVE